MLIGIWGFESIDDHKSQWNERQNVENSVHSDIRASQKQTNLGNVKKSQKNLNSIEIFLNRIFE